jgi:hypothetical protein
LYRCPHCGKQVAAATANTEIIWCHGKNHTQYDIEGYPTYGNWVGLRQMLEAQNETV